jgi:hypothetical protein
MPTFKLTWLPKALRDAGLQVSEVKGWETRGHGDMGIVRGVLCHHTAGPKTGDAPSLNVVLNGRPDLPGPLSQLVLARSGIWHVVAAGRSYHAGAGTWQGVESGNMSFIGIEAENTGLPNDPWPEAQLVSYAKGAAAMLRYLKAPSIMCAGHKEYATPKGRKSDPSFDMVSFRCRVASLLGESASA